MRNEGGRRGKALHGYRVSSGTASPRLQQQRRENDGRGEAVGGEDHLQDSTERTREDKARVRRDFATIGRRKPHCTAARMDHSVCASLLIFLCQASPDLTTRDVTGDEGETCGGTRVGAGNSLSLPRTPLSRGRGKWLQQGRRKRQQRSLEERSEAPKAATLGRPIAAPGLPRSPKPR